MTGLLQNAESLSFRAKQPPIGGCLRGNPCFLDERRIAAARKSCAARGRSLNAFLLLHSLGILLTGFLIVFINVPINTVLMRMVERDKLSKASSIISVASQGLIPIASVLAGAVLQLFGSAPLLFICAAGFTATALFLLINRDVREI